MYLQIGKNTILREEDILGIFDLDITSQSHITRKYLSTAEKAGCVINAAEDIPKTFVVCGEASGDPMKIYLSQAASATLLRRSEAGLFRDAERKK